MQETFLHYIWQSRSLDFCQLKTTQDEPIKIQQFGHHNENAGPDFLEAKISLSDVIWSGSVEMHIKSSMWHQHNHDADPAYENVILHVVWEHDQEILHRDGQIIPCVQLRDFVDQELIEKYDLLTHQISEFPCHYALPKVAVFQQQAMLEKSAIERLQQKATVVFEILQQVNYDWEEVSFRMMLTGFGMKVNKSPMIRLGETLPYKYLKKHADQPLLVEALLFGQAGMLNKVSDHYGEELFNHYRFLAHKYELSTSLQRPQWKFSRLRPINFPTIRLAQLAQLFAKHPQLFDSILHLTQLKEITSLFNISASRYWLSHYDFGKNWSKETTTLIGKNMIHHLIINVFAPILVAASQYFDEQQSMDKAIQWLEAIPTESNKITRKFEKMMFPVVNAMDSQGCLSLYYNYCLKKNCLRCNIGTAILKS